MKNKKIRNELVALSFLAPWIIGLIAFALWPIVNSFILSFTKFDIFNPMQFIGLRNFQEMLFQDGRFIKSIKVTSKYVLLAVPLKLICALIIAMLLEKNVRGMHIYRTIYYLPSLIGCSVAVAVMWRKIFELDGLFNSFLALFGITGTEWLGHPDHALNLIILLRVWQFGSSMVIFLAGLKNVPEELYEASIVDGANNFQKFIHITLPMLSPVIQFNLVLQTIGSFQIFTQGFIITQGGPMDETLFSVLYIYRVAFDFLRMGYACAISWMLLFLIALVTSIIFWSSKYWVFYASEQER